MTDHVQLWITTELLSLVKRYKQALWILLWLVATSYIKMVRQYYFVYFCLQWWQSDINYLWFIVLMWHYYVGFMIWFISWVLHGSTVHFTSLSSLAGLFIDGSLVRDHAPHSFTIIIITWERYDMRGFGYGATLVGHHSKSTSSGEKVFYPIATHKCCFWSRKCNVIGCTLTGYLLLPKWHVANVN